MRGASGASLRGSISADGVAHFSLKSGPFGSRYTRRIERPRTFDLAAAPRLVQLLRQWRDISQHLMTIKAESAKTPIPNTEIPAPLASSRLFYRSLPAAPKRRSLVPRNRRVPTGPVTTRSTHP